MSYADRRRRSHPAQIAAVAAVHLALGYALVTATGIEVSRFVPPIMTATLYPEAPPPPKVPPEPAVRRLLPASRPTAAKPIVETATLPIRDVFVVPVDDTPLPPVRIDPVPPPPPSSLARGAAPLGDRAGWVTAEDYPAAALRAGVEGTVAIAVQVGADGRVTACEVTAGSGSAALDAATCRTYARRARFRPALDEHGAAVATRHTDRVTWRIPQ